MPEQRNKYYNRRLIYSPLLFVLGIIGNFLFHAAAKATEDGFESDGPLILEPIVQGYPLTDYAYVYEEDATDYISLSQMAVYIGFKYEKKGDELNIYWGSFPKQINVNIAEKTITADGKSLPYKENYFKRIENTMFASIGFYQDVMKIDTTINHLGMQLQLDSQQEFPETIKRNMEKRRYGNTYAYNRDTFKDYEFDERWTGTPVVDINLGKGWSHRKGNGTTNSDSYSVNVAALAAGLDVNAYIFGDSYNDREPRLRLSGSREFLSEPPNKLNLKKLNIGDLTGVSNSYFTDASQGRGVSLSSFKNLVMSADKTIDITGPLQEGWQVELYWNEQLLGFRQSGINGQYNFENLPVSYGLNVFKLIFYGPYGETRTEEKRYYSGTSPVKKGEFGYNFAAYQPDRYLVEEHEPLTYQRKTNKAIVDMTGYYGLTDNLTMMGGYTQTPNEQRTETQNFGMGGLQYAIDGLSLQYNLEQNLDTNKIGHHMEAQGDVYIGTLYAAIDKFNHIQSPLSAYGTDYIKNQYETRLSGILPWSMPYYVSWRRGEYEYMNQNFDDISARISKALGNGWNMSLENTYYTSNNGGKTYDDLRLGAYKWWGLFSLESWITQELSPESRLKELRIRGDLRTGRRTYLSTEYTHNLLENMDYLSVSAGKVFDFGGLTLTLQTDRDLNLSTWLNYNISFAKVPDENKIIATGNSRFSETGTVQVNLEDEQGKPIEGVGINANGLEREVYTDSKGRAILMDLQAYEKTILRVDEETFPDVALHPENIEKKVVLRPGTIRQINIPFIHKGSVEGKIHSKGNSGLMFGYLIKAVNTKDEEILSTFADTEGYFVLDGLPYGDYKLIVSKDSQILAEVSNIKINDVQVYLEKEIVFTERMEEDELPKDKKFIITPERYVGIKEKEDEEFDEKMLDLTSDLSDILGKAGNTNEESGEISHILNKEIKSSSP